MLVPAILFKDQITSEFQRIYYTEDMMYLTGCLEQWSPDISTNPEEGKFDFAIVSNDKLIGYLSYRIDYYCSKAYNFGLLSFDRGNPVVGEELFNKMEELTKKLRKIEWRMVGGNPVEKHYDKFCKKHGGNKHILKDSIRDMNGNYRDDIIYEIISGYGKIDVHEFKERIDAIKNPVKDTYEDLVRMFESREINEKEYVERYNRLINRDAEKHWEPVEPHEHI